LDFPTVGALQTQFPNYAPSATTAFVSRIGCTEPAVHGMKIDTREPAIFRRPAAPCRAARQ
jgi:hypothetical protein